MNRKLVKTITGYIVGAGVALIANEVIKGAVPEQVRLYKKALVWVGTVAITGTISSAVSEHAERQVDEAFDAIAALKTGTQETDAVIVTENN